MTPQVISAGKIRLHNDTDYANQHFDNLRREYSDALNRLRAFVDDAIDTGDFVRASETVRICCLSLDKSIFSYNKLDRKSVV